MAEVGCSLKDEWKHVMSLEDKACNWSLAMLAQIPLAETCHVAKFTKSTVGQSLHL